MNMYHFKNLPLILILKGFCLVMATVEFEDDFTDSNVNRNKWQINHSDVKCKKYFAQQFSCDSKSEINLRQINDFLALSANSAHHHSKYSFTSATIISKTHFNLDQSDKYIKFEIRASIPTYSWLNSRVLLIPNATLMQDMNTEGGVITILSNDQKLLIPGTYNQQGQYISHGDIYSDSNPREFNTYQFELHQDKFIWFMNDKEYFRTTTNETNLYFSSNLIKHDSPFRLVITLQVDKSYSGEKADCSSFILDYIKIDKIKITESLSKIINSKSKEYSIEQVCSAIKMRSKWKNLSIILMFLIIIFVLTMVVLTYGKYKLKLKQPSMKKKSIKRPRISIEDHNV